MPSALIPLEPDDKSHSFVRPDATPNPDEKSRPHDRPRLFQPNEPPLDEETRPSQPDVPSWWWADDEPRPVQPDEPPPDDETRPSAVSGKR
jgi:hypothetical protein